MLKNSPHASLHLLRPLRHARFRQLWWSKLLSHLGMSMQAFATAWLMTRQSQAPWHTALVQTAACAPMLLLSLPAGWLAERVDRPRLLLSLHAAMALSAVSLAALCASDRATAELLLLLSTCMGVGVALSLPAWQTSMGGLVPEAELADAVALNNLSFNVSALLGPALAGLCFEYSGAAALFLANAVCFSGLLYGYARWARERSASAAPPPQHKRPSLRASWRRFRASPAFLHLLGLTAGMFFAAMALPCLLPLLVDQLWQGDAASLGRLMAGYGAGAVTGALSLAALRRRLLLRARLSLALAGQALMLMALPAVAAWARLPLLVLGGLAWAVLVCSLNAMAQQAFATTWRARALSIYLLLAAAGQTVGSLCWGGFAASLGLRYSLLIAGLAMLLNAGWLRGPLPALDSRTVEE